MIVLPLIAGLVLLVWTLTKLKQDESANHLKYNLSSSSFVLEEYLNSTRVEYQPKSTYSRLLSSTLTTSSMTSTTSLNDQFNKTMWFTSGYFRYGIGYAMNKQFNRYDFISLQIPMKIELLNYIRDRLIDLFSPSIGSSCIYLYLYQRQS